MNKKSIIGIFSALLLVSCNNNDYSNFDVNPNNINGGGGGSSTATTTAAFFSQYEGTAKELTGALDFTDFSNFSISAGAAAPTSTETIISAPSTGYEDYVENFLYDSDTGEWDTGVKSIAITYADGGVSCQLYSKKGKAKGDPFTATTTLKDDDTDSVEAIVSIDGQHVTVTAYKKYNYVLSGEGSTGSSFKLYSDKKFELTLNGVTLSNDKGAAINIQKGKSTGEDKRCYLIVKGTNTLQDAATYTTADDEDEKGVIFSEGKILVSGDGTLNVSCKGKNGIASDDYVYLHDGPTINITQPNCYDGIKGKDALYIAGGSTTVISSGAATYDSSESDYDQPACYKSDKIFISGGLIQAKATGAGGKGLRADSLLVVNGGEVKVITTGKTLSQGSNDAEAKGIHVGEKSSGTGEIYFNGGHVAVKCTVAEAIESKHLITVTGSFVEAYSADDAINAGSTQTNNGLISVKGGAVYAYSSGNDAIDSNGTFSFSGGVSFASGTSAPEAGFDCDQNTFAVTGGVLIGMGGDCSTPTTASCSQPSFITSLSLSNGTVYNITSSDGTCIASFKAPRTLSGAKFLFSSPKLSQGSSYSITSGGTPTIGSAGLSFQNIFTKDVSISGSTSSLGSITLSSMVTGSTSSMGGGGQPGGGGFPGMR